MVRNQRDGGISEYTQTYSTAARTHPAPTTTTSQLEDIFGHSSFGCLLYFTPIANIIITNFYKESLY